MPDSPIAEVGPAASSEAARLAALRRYSIIDTMPEAEFDRIVRIAGQICCVPISLVSFIDDKRQWFKAKLGLGLSETPRAIAFCNTTIESREILLIPDASLDPRFADNPLVTSKDGIRFYAGAPLLTPDGFALGTLCVIDTQPRPGLTPEQSAALVDLAAVVMCQLELRREIAARESSKQRSALREGLLEVAAGTSDFQAAIDAAITQVGYAVGSEACLLMRVASDASRIELVGGEASLWPMAHHLVGTLRALGLQANDTDPELAIASGTQLILDSHMAPLREQYPSIDLGAEFGPHTLITIPMLVGGDKYAMVGAFSADTPDLTLPASLLQDAASAMRPVLLRLRDREETGLFRCAFEASGDAMIISDTGTSDGVPTVIRYVNEAFLQQTGYSREQIIGQSPSILEGPETSTQAKRDIRAALAAHRPVRQDILTYRRDGSSFWAELSISPLANQIGWYERWVTIQRDVALRKAEAYALAESEASFRYFFEQHPAPMWVYDKASLAFLEVNDAAVASYGWSREEFLGMTLLDIQPEEEREATRAAAANASYGYSDTGPWHHLTASGDPLFVQVRSQIIQFRGHASGLVAIWDVTERIKAEDAARKLTIRLNATMESIGDVFYTLDSQWRYTYVNDETARVVQHDRSELIGRNIWEVFPAAAETELFERFHRVVQTQQAERFDLFYEPLASWFNAAVYPAADGLTIFLRDITQERSRNERLYLLEAVVEQLNDMIVITQAEPLELPGRRIVFVNAAYERQTGYSAAETLGKTRRMLQGPDTDKTELARIHAALDAWQPIRTELLNYKKNGEAIWFEIDMVPVTNETGRYTHWVAVERDVTERKHAQLQLEQQAALLDQARDAILVRGMDHRIQYWNRSAERLYGWSAAEALGASALDLLYSEPEEFARATAALLVDGYWSGRLRQRRKDGSAINAEVNWTLVRDKNGVANAVLAVVWDVTERLALEKQLRQSQRLEAVGQLTGGVAHDFNNLLTVILGNGEMLMDSLADNDELRPLAELTVAAAERGAALTSRLLAFSRRQALDPKVTDVNRLLAGLEQLLRRTIGEHVQIILTPTADLWSALIDPPQLESAVLNLAINARDAMPRGGTITIETCNVAIDAETAEKDGEVVAGEYVMVSVADTGTGMTPEVLAQAFEPFFTTKEVGQGSGLGLSMVYGFAKQSGGHVKITSEPGQGAVVRMYFPAADPQLSSTPIAVASGKLPGGKEHVLLVEDDALVREHVHQQLRALGYLVTAAENGAHALEVLRQGEHFDLLFTDVVMPGGMTGRELATAVKLLRPGLRILFTSGYSENTIVHDGRLDEGIMLLEKPYRRQELAEKIRLALDMPP